MLLISNLSTCFCLVFWLNVLVPLAVFFPPPRDRKPPISLCFPEDDRSNGSLAGMVCIWTLEHGRTLDGCDSNYIRLCTTEGDNCKPHYRSLCLCDNASKL